MVCDMLIVVNPTENIHGYKSLDKPPWSASKRRNYNICMSLLHGNMYFTVFAIFARCISACGSMLIESTVFLCPFTHIGNTTLLIAILQNNADINTLLNPPIKIKRIL